MSVLLQPALDLSCFPSDYPQARQKFRQLAASAGDCTATTLAASGPAGEELSIDSCWIGPEDATRVMVIISGTHGIEGLAGSAIQCDLLAQLLEHPEPLLPDSSLLLIHGLNPWGMSWLRRCDAAGIDLNRNFIDFAGPVPQNPGYAALRSMIWSKDAGRREDAFRQYRAEHGQQAFEVAISGGQYIDPAGPFYGGTGPALAHTRIAQYVADHQLAGRELAVIDLHTGLGPFGYGEIICDHSPGSSGHQTAQRWYGESVTLPAEGTSFSVPKQGLMDYYWHGIMGSKGCFITLEFGTYSTEQLFHVLMTDHHLHRQGTPDWEAPETRSIKAQLVRHFYPASMQWRELVLFRARQVIALGYQGLCHA